MIIAPYATASRGSSFLKKAAEDDRRHINIDSERTSELHD